MNKIILINFVQLISFILITTTHAVPMFRSFDDEFDKYYKRYHPRNGLSSYESLVRDLAIYKRKLQLLGYFPVVYQKPSGKLENYYYPRQELPPVTSTRDESIDQESNEPLVEFYESADENPKDFNDLEVLQLIPVIVEQLKQGSVTEEEEGVLKSIFGDLWSVILDEAARASDDPIHPLLDILMKSNEVTHNKRNAYENDVEQNTVGLKKPQMSPSDQLLHRTWSIVSRSMLEKNERDLEKQVKRKVRKPKHPVFVPSPFDLEHESSSETPRFKRISSRRRHKRSFHITKSDDLTKMKALVNYLNAHEDDNGDEASSEENIDFDYFDGMNSYRHTKPTYNHPSIYELFHLADQHRRRRQNRRY